MERLDSSWRTASYSARAVDGFLLQVAAGEFTGTGGTAAHPNSITADDLELQLAGPVKDSCIAQDPRFRTAILNQAKAAKIHSRALIALDLALYDLLGKIANLPCHAFWGGALRTRVAAVRMIGVKPPDELCSAIKALTRKDTATSRSKLALRWLRM